MSNEDLHLEEEEEQEEQSTPDYSTPQQGNSDEDASDNETQSHVDWYNNLGGGKHKSEETIKKTIAESRKLFSDKGRQANSMSSPVNEEEAKDEMILTGHDPNAQFVMDDIKEVARTTNKSIFTAYKENSWLQAKATSEAEKEVNLKKVGSPSNQVKQGKTEEDKIEKIFSGNLPKGYTDK